MKTTKDGVEFTKGMQVWSNKGMSYVVSAPINGDPCMGVWLVEIKEDGEGGWHSVSPPFSDFVFKYYADERLALTVAVCDLKSKAESYEEPLRAIRLSGSTLTCKASTTPRRFGTMTCLRTRTVG
jgi:hypothetical protein